MEYHVVWECDVDAKSPRAAAQQCALYQRDSNGVFDVTNSRGRIVRVDLADISPQRKIKK